MMLESTGASVDSQPSLHALGLSMSTTSGGLEIAEFCQQAHAKSLAQRFVNLTNDVPFWTACSANEWLDKLNGAGRGRTAGRGGVGCRVEE